MSDQTKAADLMRAIIDNVRAACDIGDRHGENCDAKMAADSIRAVCDYAMETGATIQAQAQRIAELEIRLRATATGNLEVLLDMHDEDAARIRELEAALLAAGFQEPAKEQSE